MENVPIGKAFGILKWWTALKPLDKLFSFMIAVFVSSAVINFYQYKEIARLQNEKTLLEKENLSYAKDCEARVAKVTIKERDRSDSILQNLYTKRISEITNKNEKIKNVLK